MSSYDGNKSARYLILVMKVLGMWDFDNKQWNAFYHIYGWIIHSIFTFTFITLMFVQVGFSTNAESLSRALYMSLTEISLVIKVLNVMLRAKKMVLIFEKNELLIEGKPKNQQEYQSVKKSGVVFCQLRNAHYFLTIGYLTGTFFSTLYKNSYTLPHPMWLPFNYHNSTDYYYVFAYYFASLFVTAISNCTMDVVQSYFLYKIATYYKILGVRLENLGRETGDVKVDLLTQIKFHSAILKLTKDCQFLISVPVFVQITISAFVICFSMYLLQKLSFLQDTPDFILFTVFASVMALQIFLPCIFGNEVTTSAAYLKTCIYNSNWLSFPLNIQKIIFIYMEYLKWPVFVKAGNFFEIGYGVFVQVMNNAYRLYAVMLNIDN